VKVAVVGQGAMGRALSGALRKAGATTMDVRARGRWPDLSGADIVILSVRDDVIAEVAAALMVLGPGKSTVLHCCGAMPASEALAPLVNECAVGTLHPLVSVVDAAGFLGVPFAVEGDEARRLALLLGGIPFAVEPAAFPRYHAAAVFAANYVVTLLDVAIRLAVDAGLEEAAAREALGALATGVAANVRRLGAEAALTGPIARGDKSVVARHLEALPAELRPLYEALASATRELAARRRPTSS